MQKLILLQSRFLLFEWPCEWALQEKSSLQKAFCVTPGKRRCIAIPCFQNVSNNLWLFFNWDLCSRFYEPYSNRFLSFSSTPLSPYASKISRRNSLGKIIENAVSNHESLPQGHTTRESRSFRTSTMFQWRLKDSGTKHPILPPQLNMLNTRRFHVQRMAWDRCFETR